MFTGIKGAIKPVEAPVPPGTIPTEATHAETATRAAINRAPEKDGFAFPFFWNKLGVCQ